MSNNATLQRAIPLLATTNIAHSVAFFERIGFERGYQDENYAIITRDAVALHLWLCDDKNIADNTSCRVQVTNIAALYAECQQHDAIHPNGALAMQPWGQEFAILDPDGSMVTFLEPAPREPVS